MPEGHGSAHGCINIPGDAAATMRYNRLRVAVKMIKQMGKLLKKERWLKISIIFFDRNSCNSSRTLRRFHEELSCEV
jgi:hypothetical protein